MDMYRNNSVLIASKMYFNFFKYHSRPQLFISCRLIRESSSVTLSQTSSWLLDEKLLDGARLEEINL